MVNIFNLGLLVSALTAVDIDRRSLFAAMTAERLAPLFRVYARSNPEKAEVLDNGLSYLWSNIASGPSNAAPAESNVWLKKIEEIIPLEDDGLPFSAQADDAASALMYAIRSLASLDAKEAAWAAQRAYDSIDSFVNRLPDSSGVVPSGYTDSHPLLDGELSTQSSDIKLARDANIEELEALRKRSADMGQELTKKFIGLSAPKL